MKKKYCIILIVFLIILLLMGTGIFLWSNFKRDKSSPHIEKKVNYLANVYSYVLANDADDSISSSNYNDGDFGVFDNYQEYVDFVTSNDINIELVEGDFSSNKYVYYVLKYDPCLESINGVSNVSYVDGNVNIVFGIDRNCSNCDYELKVFFVPIERDVQVNNVIIDYDIIHDSGINSRDIAYKPILYLYPEKDMNISVKVEHPDMLLTTYPKYNNGWNMFVKKNGDMYDMDGKYYYALYWDELQLNKVDFSKGFYVEGYNAIEFLEDKLSIIGLSDKERNEFIMYWLPKLESNGKSLVYFELTKEIDSYNKLIINPKPDSILRVIMHIKKVDKKVNIQEEKLEHFDRKGFVAVEWGGTIYGEE